MAGQGKRPWLALAVIALLLIALMAYQWHSVLSHRTQESALSSQSFSHGLVIGQRFDSRENLFSYLAERGYEYEREAEKGNYEFLDSSGALLLRVKEFRHNISAVYLFVLPGHEVNADGRDLLGLTAMDLRNLLGVPRRIERRSRAARPAEPASEAARIVETWFYEARIFDLTVGLDRTRRVVEVILQGPIAR